MAWLSRQLPHHSSAQLRRAQTVMQDYEAKEGRELFIVALPV